MIASSIALSSWASRVREYIQHMNWEHTNVSHIEHTLMYQAISIGKNMQLFDEYSDAMHPWHACTALLSSMESVCRAHYKFDEAQLLVSYLREASWSNSEILQVTHWAKSAFDYYPDDEEWAHALGCTQEEVHSIQDALVPHFKDTFTATEIQTWTLCCQMDAAFHQWLEHLYPLEMEHYSLPYSKEYSYSPFVGF